MQKFPPHHKRAATLPCEMQTFENVRKMTQIVQELDKGLQW